MMSDDAVDPAYARGWVAGLEELRRRVELLREQNRAARVSPLDAGLTSARMLALVTEVQGGFDGQGR